MSHILLAVFSTPMPRNIDPREDLRYFSWVFFALLSLAYSAFVFMGELSKDGPLIFSKRNSRSTSELLVSHAAFLVVLFCSMRIFNFVVPTLPYWMTDTFKTAKGGRASIADVAFFALAPVLVYFERKWLIVESTTEVGSGA